MTQVELSEKSGVSLRFVRKMEQGHTNLQVDKVNQVPALFGCELGAIKIQEQCKVLIFLYTIVKH
jgi:predicted transcriptional regulator